MNAQYLEFVRQQLIVATADLSGATKGQLVAFAENVMFTSTPRGEAGPELRWERWWLSWYLGC